jgi:hypothetical protein
MKSFVRRFSPTLWALSMVLMATAVTVGQDVPPGGTADDEDQAFAFRDNSFLIEEAYNQEPGTVQHLFNWVPSWDRDRGTRCRGFDFVFIQEWPLGSQVHQFSYTIPFEHLAESGDGVSSNEGGLADMMLNYRLQVFDGKDEPFAFAPRFSLILPTGDEDKGLGNDRLGYQVNLPVSAEAGRWACHFNAGLTVVPDVEVGLDPQYLGQHRTLNGYNLGLSVIYALKPKFHLMLESVALWDENLLHDVNQDRTTEVLLSPGFRWLAYEHEDTQLVTGLGLPIGLSRDAANLGAIFYLSLEHRFRPAQ